jgi:FkbM family methyltransferase
MCGETGDHTLSCKALYNTSMLKTLAYSLLDYSTGKKGICRTINGFKVRFPARWSRYYESDYEADNYSFLKHQLQPGDHVIDVGAHLGLFSVISAQLVGAAGKVICFEPTPATFEVLRQTLERNKAANVIPVWGAVSSRNGTDEFFVSEIAGCNSNSLVLNKDRNCVETVPVHLYTIDAVVNEHDLRPVLIKIDAEGAELDVLKGGVLTLRTQKPALILGLHPAFITQKGDSLVEIWDSLMQCGYTVSQNGRDLTKHDFCTRTSLFDVHCVCVT